MPHDRNGNLVSVGDIVTIAFKVKSVTMNEEFCNCNLESCLKMPGSLDDRINLSAVNTAQTQIERHLVLPVPPTPEGGHVEPVKGGQ